MKKLLLSFALLFASAGFGQVYVDVGYSGGYYSGGYYGGGYYGVYPVAPVTVAYPGYHFSSPAYIGYPAGYYVQPVAPYRRHHHHHHHGRPGWAPYPW